MPEEKEADVSKEAAVSPSPKKKPATPKGKTVLARITLLDGTLLDLNVEVRTCWGIRDVGREEKSNEKVVLIKVYLVQYLFPRESLPLRFHKLSLNSMHVAQENSKN